MDHALTEMLGFGWLVPFLVELLLARAQHFFSAATSAAAAAGALATSVQR